MNIIYPFVDGIWFFCFNTAKVHFSSHSTSLELVCVTRPALFSSSKLLTQTCLESKLTKLITLSVNTVLNTRTLAWNAILFSLKRSEISVLGLYHTFWFLHYYQSLRCKQNSITAVRVLSYTNRCYVILKPDNIYLSYTAEACNHLPLILGKVHRSFTSLDSNAV